MGGERVEEFYVMKVGGVESLCDEVVREFM